MVMMFWKRTSQHDFRVSEMLRGVVARRELVVVRTGESGRMISCWERTKKDVCSSGDVLGPPLLLCGKKKRWTKQGQKAKGHAKENNEALFLASMCLCLYFVRFVFVIEGGGLF